MKFMRMKSFTSVIEIRPWKHSTIVDRRSTARLELTYAVYLSRPGEAFGIVTKTENVSSKGFYCLSKQPFFPGEILDCEMAIPGGLEANDLILSGVVEVLRVIPRGIARGFGLACRLESYTIAPRPV
jgi:hypothetical protein